MSQSQAKKKTFSSLDPSFCDGCGALLPAIPPVGDIHCLACKKVIPVDGFDETETTYTIYFNKAENVEYEKGNQKKRGNKDTDLDAEGPTVDRKCPKCDYEKMSYATLQLRSADEGQTVFFTCLKCKFKESENS